MLQTLSSREPNDWQLRLPIRTAWLKEIRLALGGAGHTKFKADYELYRSLDSLMIEVTSAVSIMAQFDQLLEKVSHARETDNEYVKEMLIDLHETAESLLSRNEARLALWNKNICEISFSSWLSLSQDMPIDPISGCSWVDVRKDIGSYFDTVLTFRTLLEYHSITTYWTIIMSLRLLLSDMLTLMVRTDENGMPANSRQKIEDHRIQLMKYALNVLRATCYATHTESNAVAPFAFATAFQLTVAVLERECKSLQAATGDNEDKIRRCEGLKSLAVRYLDWAMRNKVPVKIDLYSPRKWEFGSL